VRIKAYEATYLNEIGSYLQTLLTTPHSKADTMGGFMY